MPYATLPPLAAVADAPGLGLKRGSSHTSPQVGGRRTRKELSFAVLPEPGGFEAIIRRLSEATPPDMTM
jgi:hypothetical protein